MAAVLTRGAHNLARIGMGEIRPAHFQPLPSNDLRLFLPIATLRRMIEEIG
jgi:hypothetical protein